MEDKRQNDGMGEESNAARRVKALGLDREERDETVVDGDKWENFWYHYKWYTIIALAFAAILIITTVQFVNKENRFLSASCRWAAERRIHHNGYRRNRPGIPPARWDLQNPSALPRKLRM